MRAAVCHGYGPPEVIRIEDLSVAEPGPGEVRVRVTAAAVNFPDVLIVANEYQLSVPPPFVPGSEFAGVVDALGDGVDSLTAGDRVFGTGMHGAFAEAVVVPAASVQPVPESVGDAAAAAFGVAHRTAFHTLRSVAKLHPGEVLVVLGAGGGVGLAAVQLGAVLGASVVAVASSAAKLEVAAAHGATTCIDHRSGDLRQALRDAIPDGADVVIDPVGGDLAEPALRSLRWRGRFVTVGYASGAIPRVPLNLVLLKGIEIRGFEFLSFATNLADEFHRNEQELMQLLDAGRATPYIGARFALDDAAAALRFVADGKAIGKVVLEIRR